MDERLRFVARLARRREDGGAVPRVRYLAQDRLQDLPALQGLRPRWPDRSQPPALPARQPAAVPDREADRPAQARAAELGRAEDPREAAPPHSDVHSPGDQHRARGARSPWPGQPRSQAPPQGAGHARCRGRCTPNDLWCADYKGEFMLADRRYCYPLTITDFASRYLLACEALVDHPGGLRLHRVRARASRSSACRKAIRTDNGVPFASAHALFGLSKLAVWWLRLGIRIERIKPGHPEQNGRHERMHLTLKKEATKPAAQNFLQQQAKFDDFIDCYNQERPHQALDMKLSRRALPALTATLSRPRRARVPVPRPHRHRHPLRPHLPRQAQDQPQSGLRRAERRHQGGQR